MSIFSGILSAALSKSSQNGRIDISFICNGSVVVMPIVPNPGPELDSPQNNEVFSAVTGDLKVIGALGLRSLTLESFWPTTKNYSFARYYGSSGTECISFFEAARKAYKPIRCIIVYSNGQDILNMLCLVDDFVYKTDKMGDIHYSLKISEYKDPGELNVLNLR